MELAQVVDQYEKSLISRNMAPHTSRTYKWALENFLTYVGRHGVVDASSLGIEHIEGWQLNLARKAPRTRSLASTAVRSCLRWAAQHGKPVAPTLHMFVESVQIPDALPRPVPLEDVAKIRHYFESIEAPSALDLRDWALFMCLLSTGARVAEVLQLKHRDVNRTSIVFQKRSRAVTIQVLAPVRETAARYIALRTDDDPNLWVTMNGQLTRRMTTPGVREMLRRVAVRAGVARFTTHQLRHTGATWLFRAGVPEMVIADFLGHESVESIRTYVDMTSRRQEAMRAMESLLSGIEPDVEGAPLDIESLAQGLDRVVASLNSGAVVSNREPHFDDIRGDLEAAARALRLLRT
jgi:site-specific recombinase XerD